MDPPPATPLRIAPIVLFFVAAAAAAAAAAEVVPAFRTTVTVLPSLDSLVPLARAPARVAGLEVAAAGLPVTASRLALVAVVVLLDLDKVVSEAVVTLRVLPYRVAFARSTMLDSTPETAAVRPVPDLRGEPGWAICDLGGDAGRSRAVKREFDDVGDRTCVGRTPPASAPLGFFLPCRVAPSFSLSLTRSLCAA